MRVALIDPSLFTVPYDRELASGLARVGHQVTLYGRARRKLDETLGTVTLAPIFYRLAESRVGLGLPSAARLALKGLDHGWSMLRLLRLLRREPPDVIHFQWLPLPLLDAGLLRQFRRIAPVVLTVHDTDPFNGAASAGIQRRGIQSCLQAVDRLIVHTSPRSGAAGAAGHRGRANRGPPARNADRGGAPGAGRDGRCADIPAVRQDQAIQRRRSVDRGVRGLAGRASGVGKAPDRGQAIHGHRAN